ncbi:MAG: FG-GAP-like repeat-containing protein [Bacteroidota bacterium]
MTTTSTDRLRQVAERAGYSFASTPTPPEARSQSKRAPRWRRWLLASGVLFSVALGAPALQAQDIGPFERVLRSPSHPLQPPFQAPLVGGDFDNDGDMDLWGGTYADTRGQRYYEQVSPGVFVERPLGASPIPFVEAVQIREWTATDADADGDVDLLDTSTQPATLHRQVAPGIYESEPSPVPTSYRVRAYADFDQDGDLDVLVYGDVGLGQNEYYLLEQTAPGVFQDEPTDDHVFGTLASSSSYTTGQAAFADVDGDGDLDLTIAEYAYPRVAIFLQEQAGRLGPDVSMRLSLYNYPSGSPVVGDIDGDGDVDIVSDGQGVPTTFLAEAPGQFTQLDYEEGPLGFLRPQFPGVDWVSTQRASTLSDLDQDGQPEIVGIAERVGRRPVILERGDDGLYRELPPEENPLQDIDFSFSSGITATDLDTGDVDGDGDEDLLVRGTLVNPRTDKMLVVEQTPTGFELRSEGAYPFSEAPVGTPTFVDFDGDGDQDVVLNTGNPGREVGAQFVFEQTAPGVFEEHEAWSASLDALGEFQVVADFDGDGDADVYRAPTRAFFEQTAPGVFEERPDVIDAFPDLAPSRDIMTGDVEGDGDLDIVFRARDGFDYYRNDAIVVADEPTAQVPDTPALDAAYPNPFRDAATLTLALPEAQAVRVALYDVLGREVALLHDGTAPAGPLTLRVDGRRLASGVYVVRAEGATFAATRRITHLD